MRDGWAAIYVTPCAAVLLACITPPLQGQTPEPLVHLDDPASCIDVPSSAESAHAEGTESAHAAIEAELQRRIEQQWPSIRACTREAPATDPVHLEIHVRPDGKSLARVIQTQLTDCEAIACIRDRLSGLQVAPPEADRSFTSSQRLDLDARAAQHFQPEARLPHGPAPVQGPACLDGRGVGRLQPELIRATVRANFDELRKCYEGGLARNPELQGRVVFRFVIDRDGKVPNIAVGENELADCAVVRCLRDGFVQLQFPPPEGGIVTVSYPIELMPDHAPATPPASKTVP